MANLAAALTLICLLYVCSVDGKRYEIYTEKVNWFKANANCIARGDRLATVFNPREQDNLSRLLKNTAPQESYLWISLNDLGRDNKYVWFSTGKEQGNDYTNWAPGEPKNGPGESCVAIMKTGVDSQGIGNWKWNDDICRTMQTGYICDTERP